MEIHELQQLLSEMSLQEKIGQMVQLTGAYFDKEAVLTGVVGEQLPPEWIIQYAGSVLGVIGKDKIYDIQSRYMEQHPHHIPLLFMADEMTRFSKESILQQAATSMLAQANQANQGVLSLLQ